MPMHLPVSISTTMPALLVPEDTPVKTASAAQEQSENTESFLEIPGRSVHPGKLTAMLRSNFGLGEYDIMV
jgi:hypothetical protein